ncbi:MAG: hypothetical protein WBA91_09095 [Paracoccaceae bacterium]
MKHSKITALALAATLSTATSAFAVTLTPDSGWNLFGFGAIGNFATKTFEFTVAGNALVTIADGYTSGDQFEVFVDNVSQGLTSLPNNGASFVGGNFDAAAGDPNFSVWSQLFAAGTYSISLLVNARSGTDTNFHLGAIRMDTAPIPAPAAGLLLLTALGAAAAAGRRRLKT